MLKRCTLDLIGELRMGSAWDVGRVFVKEVIFEQH